jgi:hypothetical protein
MFLHDTAAFWAALSDPGSNEFNNGNAINAESNDHFYLPALKIEWAFGGMRLVSNTSYFNRDSKAINDYTSFETALWGQVFTTVHSGFRSVPERTVLSGRVHACDQLPGQSAEQHRAGAAPAVR